MIRVVLIIFVLYSCNARHKSEYIEVVSKADKLNIVYTSDHYYDTTINFTTELRKSFQNFFESKDEQCRCVVTGRLRFYSSSKIILVADFTIDKKENNGDDCESLVVFPSEYVCYSLNYNVGIFLSEIYADLNRAK